MAYQKWSQFHSVRLQILHFVAEVEIVPIQRSGLVQ